MLPPAAAFVALTAVVVATAEATGNASTGGKASLAIPIDGDEVVGIAELGFEAIVGDVAKASLRR